MNLKDRLGRLVSEPDKPSDAKQETINGLRRKIETMMNRREHIIPDKTSQQPGDAIPLENIIIGNEARTPHGAFFVSRNIINGSDVYGYCRICDLANASMDAAAFLVGHRILKDMSITGGLFIDTETTGLAGGTGTFPFLIGLGWFEADTFITCQLFARDFSEERAMLAYLSEFASTREFLVSFNGRAYDLNLLSARFILNRCRDTLSAMPHIDLLHPARRILSHRLENARLSTIEMHVLGVKRNGDVPGFEIPQRYFDWLRRRDGRLLVDIFEHNKLDIVSMASLLKYLTDLVQESEEINSSRHGDLLKLAGLIHDRGNLEKTMSILETLIMSDLSEVSTRAQQSLSLIYKKAHRWDEAVKLWQNILASDPRDVFAAVELAKFHEHQTREFGKALQIVRSLLNNDARLSDVERESLEHRLQRLLHRVPREDNSYQSHGGNSVT